MSDRSQHNLNDELLSAYLDDELSGEERALVEARLATDPAARQMLEELRHVSQSVRDLPQEAVGRDLRASILERAQSAKQAAAAVARESNGAADQAGFSMPKVSIGRTTRGWAWASLAVAAGLMIMVLQSGDEQNAVLAPVAMKNKEVAADKSGRSLEERKIAAWHASEPPADDSAGTPAAAPPAPVEDQLGDRLAIGGGVGGEAATALADKLETPALATTAPESGVSAINGSAPAQAEPAPEAPPADESELVVVRVLAKRDAVATKTFDKLLASNGIVVEPEESNEKAEEFASGARLERDEVAQSNQLDGGSPTVENSGVEAVLVEAPSATIVSCLDGLNKDVENYIAVDVDESSTPEKDAALQAASTRKVSEDLRRYNRGVMPQQESDAFGTELTVQDGADDNQLGRQLRGYAFSDATRDRARRVQAPTSANEGKVSLGWAKRLPAPEYETNRQFARSGSAGYYAKGISKIAPPANVELRGSLKTPTGGADDHLQVLFLLCPADHAVSTESAPVSAPASPPTPSRAE